jgi:hypothetical protein
MDPREFRKRLDELEHAFDADPANVKGHSLRDCKRCSSCVFCEECVRCHKCSYCKGCEGSTNLTHCVGCTACHNLANSVECSGCTSSAFLVLSRDLTECNYCFGCVGLSRKDFHILNEKFDRSTYFKMVADLSAALRVPRP